MTRIRTQLLAICCAILMLGAACSSGVETATAELPTLADSAEETATDTDDAATDDADASEEKTSDDGQSGETGEEEVDPEIAMAEYEKCMEEQGVSMSLAIEGDGGSGIETFESDPNDADLASDDEPIDFEAMEAAAEACDEILESAFGSFEMTPEQEAEMADQMLELERCLSEQGFDIDMSGNSFQIDESMDFEAFEAAMSECGNAIQSIDAGR